MHTKALVYQNIKQKYIYSDRFINYLGYVITLNHSTFRYCLMILNNMLFEFQTHFNKEGSCLINIYQTFVR